MGANIKDFFFTKYQTANANSDFAALGVLYAEVFLFAGPAGVRPVKKDDFLKVIPKRKEYFESMGLSESRVTHVEEIALDAKYLMAKTSWKMTLRVAGETREIPTSATYILEKTGEALTIVMQIDHQDLSDKLKEVAGLQ